MRSLVILALVVVLSGCGRNPADPQLDWSRDDWHGGDRHLDETTFDYATLEMVQRETGIQLPDGSRGLNMFYQGSGIDPAFVAKVHIPDSSREELASRLEEIRNKDGTVHGSLTEVVTWWTPPNGIIRVQRQFDRGGDYVRAILCQEDNQLVLYLEWVKI